MIFYFSGTGNSLQIAQRLAALLDDELFNMASNDAIHTPTNERESIGFVLPVYAWGLPKVVTDFVKRLSFSCGERYIYAVFTCGDDVGYTDALLRKALVKKEWRLNAAFSVQMRNTYVCLPGFDVDTPEMEHQKTTNAIKLLPYIAQCVAQQTEVGETHLVRGAMPWLKSYVLRPLFNRFLINDNKFWLQRIKCKKCGLCVKKCPLQNITFNNEGLLVWNGHCTHCLRCYHVCAHHAINYGKFTRNKGQVKINV